MKDEDPSGSWSRGGGSSPRTRLTILSLTVFVDLVGFGIILPLLPFYGDRFGASGTQIAILVFSYSAAQLVMAPLWGRLSDRYGRRPILILGLVGSALSYLVFAFAGSILALLLSRVMAGAAGANVPVAQAYIADVTPPEQRAGGMGLIGAAFGLGFIFGPAIGGILAPIAPEAPGLAAAGLCLGNAVLAFFFLPESLDRQKTPRSSDSSRILPQPSQLLGWSELRKIVRDRAFMEVLLLSFLFIAAFSVIHPVFPLFASERLGLDERGVGWVFAYMGTVSAIMQGGIVRVLAPRIGEQGLVRASALPFVAGLLVIGYAESLPVLLGGITLLAIGFGGSLPALVSLLSRAAPPELQGGSLGIGQSVGAVARILGPLIGGLAWDFGSMSAPFFAGAVLAALGAVRLLFGPPPLPPQPSSASKPGAAHDRESTISPPHHSTP